MPIDLYLQLTPYYRLVYTVGLINYMHFTNMD